MTDSSALMRTLADARVDFILVGGVAATVHGSARLTRAVDVVYSRTGENIQSLVDALAPLSPRGGCGKRLVDLSGSVHVSRRKGALRILVEATHQERVPRKARFSGAQS